MDKPLPGAVLPKAVVSELGEIPKLRKELADERAKRASADSERQGLEARLEHWEAAAKGSLAEEQEILKNLGWVKNAGG